ncbi:hypothetical protein NIES2101_02285 [Calothrix sp. HK-06]|nr:hypothetical protein NIES2101_02285 [Calothrix sp. HK-06]
MSSLFLTPSDFERIFTSHLKIETYSKSIDSLFTLRSLHKIDYKPYYQRNYVWDDHKATYFIESILLGTEIPPLIFFNNGTKIEVIDGRQRFETIKRFKENDFSLTRNGLAALKQLAKSTYHSLQNNQETAGIIELFLDAKIRIIEFEIVNEPKLNSSLEDKVKKEIFGRYNSGITPLKKPEIDNAVYDADPLFQNFKKIIRNNTDFSKTIIDIFLSPRESSKDSDVGKILQFIRRYLVLHQFPIKYYAWGNNRTETLDKLYEFLVTQTENVDQLTDNFLKKISIIREIKDTFIKLHLQHNRLVFECLLWGLQVLESEGCTISNLNETDLIHRLCNKISSNIGKYTEIESNYYSQVYERFFFTASLLEDEFDIILRAYIDGDKKVRDDLKKLRMSESNDTVTKLGELASLRVTKPEPSRNSIDDIARVMGRNMFLVRPSYQRSEVISVSKASSIIESILLDISLPPIFIYKRNDGISEVIDGQQRLLTILGFIGEKYVDENNSQCTTKNSGFSLKGLQILEKLNNKSYKDLNSSLQDKILDFELFVVEIREDLNPQFNPVDLFVRLNNKPYPIRENSFEMWNSWVDREIIATIRDNVKKHREWFYTKIFKGRNDRDRMENEELYMSLVYLEFQRMKSNNSEKYLYIYSKNDGISVRIGSSQDITKLLQNVSEDEEVKANFIKGIKAVEYFIKKIKTILLDRDVSQDKSILEKFFTDELNSLFKAQRQIRSFRRTKQDFYILWYLLAPLNIKMVQYHRLEIKKDLQKFFHILRNNSEIYRETFMKKCKNFMQNILHIREKLNFLKQRKLKCLGSKVIAVLFQEHLFS